ncbi:MAG TPA: tetratricopeptide repeat protein [Pyrinomonadaceae bacterium]|jgi:type IV pilus assembly protein PilF
MRRNYFQQTTAALFAVLAVAATCAAQSGATRPRRVNPQTINEAAAKEQSAPDASAAPAGTPAQAGGDTTRAYALLQQGQFEAAAREARQVASANPANGEAWKIVGFAEVGLKQYAQAATDLQKALDLQRAAGEPDPNTEDKLAQSLVLSEQFERALPLLVAATSRPGKAPDAAMLYSRGLAEYQTKKIEDAERSFNAAVKADPKNAAALFYLGRIAFDRGQADAAIAALNRATAADPRLAQAWSLLTVSYLRRAAEGGDTPKANENYLNAVRTSDALVRLRADESSAALNAQALVGAKQYARAAAVLETVASGAGVQGSTLYLLGVAYNRAKNYPRAAAALERAAAKTPENAEVFRELGFSYEVSKQYAKALAAYQKGAQLSPDDADFKEAVERVRPFAK